MLNWLNFWNIIFWLSIMGFLINLENFFKILMYSEMVWVILYTYTIILGSTQNDLNVIGSSIYILALAGLEFSMGILLLILFKNNNKTLELSKDTKDNIINKKNLKPIKLYW